MSTGRQGVPRPRALLVLTRIFKNQRKDERVQKLLATVKDRSTLDADDLAAIDAIKPTPSPPIITPKEARKRVEAGKAQLEKLVKNFKERQ